MSTKQQAIDLVNSTAQAIIDEIGRSDIEFDEYTAYFHFDRTYSPPISKGYSVQDGVKRQIRLNIPIFKSGHRISTTTHEEA